MFEDSGKIIQKISIVFFVIGMTATVILAFVFGRDNWGDVNYLFFVILVGGGFTVYIDALLLNGFGIIVENNEAQKAALEKEKMKTAADKGSNNKETPQINRSENRQSQNQSNGGWTCACGRHNQDYVFTCSCGRSKSSN